MGRKQQTGPSASRPRGNQHNPHSQRLSSTPRGTAGPQTRAGAGVTSQAPRPPMPAQGSPMPPSPSGDPQQRGWKHTRHAPRGTGTTAQLITVSLLHWEPVTTATDTAFMEIQILGFSVSPLSTIKTFCTKYCWLYKVSLQHEIPRLVL